MNHEPTKKTRVDFNSTPEETMTIHLIAKRAVKLAQQLEIRLNLFELNMDITACHRNGNPLKLKELLNAKDTDFCHDVFGIRKYIDRTTGKLTQCFSPRYSV